MRATITLIIGLIVLGFAVKSCVDNSQSRCKDIKYMEVYSVKGFYSGYLFLATKPTKELGIVEGELLNPVTAETEKVVGMECSNLYQKENQ